MIKKSNIASVVVLTLAACGQGNGEYHKATLYRNSPLDPSMRVHFATFDVHETSPRFNIGNCEMAVRLLNANLQAQNQDSDLTLGFWCEPGDFQEDGTAPFQFDSAYPTQSNG